MRALVFDALYCAFRKTPRRHLCLCSLLSNKPGKAVPASQHFWVYTQSKEALLILVNAVDIPLEKAECRIKPPNNLPIKTRAMPIELSRLGAWDLVADDTSTEPLEEGNSVEKPLSDGLLWEEGLVGG